MPLHIDRAAIAARQHERAQHEVSLERANARGASAAPGRTAPAEPADEPAGDVAVDVRGVGAGAADELANVERADSLARKVRGASIAALRAAHGEVDTGRAVALLRD